MLADKLRAAALSNRMPTFINHSTAIGGSSVSPSAPSGTQDGDLMIAVASIGAGPSTWTFPAGWTEVYDQGSGASLAVAYRYASSEPGSYTFTPSAASACGAGIATFRNAQYNQIGSAGTGTSSATAGNITVNQGYILIVVADGNGSDFTTSSSTLTEIVDVDAVTLTRAIYFDPEYTGSISNVADRTATYSTTATAITGIVVDFNLP